VAKQAQLQSVSVNLAGTLETIPVNREVDRATANYRGTALRPSEIPTISSENRAGALRRFDVWCTERIRVRDASGSGLASCHHTKSVYQDDRLTPRLNS
jgi:hypothetical protein